MLNYLRAELYRNLNRMYFWMFSGVMALLAVTINIVASANNLEGVKLSMLLQSTLFVLVAPVYMLAGIVDMVTSEETKYLTMRNAIAFGVSRYKIILSKFITSTILAALGAIMVLGLFYGSGLLLFGMDADVSGVASIVGVRLLVATPLWMGAISIGTFLALAINNNTLFGFAYAGVFMLTSNIIYLLAYLVSDKFLVIKKYLITVNLQGLKAEGLTSGELWTSAGIGAAYTIGFLIISMLYFRRKEIK